MPGCIDRGREWGASGDILMNQSRMPYCRDAIRIFVLGERGGGMQGKHGGWGVASDPWQTGPT